MTVGVDVGGTFTDVVYWDGESFSTAKVSTAVRQAEGVALGCGEVLGDRTDGLLLHGTTVATNALLERRGAKVALVTDAGFEGLIEIGRQDRPSLYDTFADRPPPLVEPDLRWGWPQPRPLPEVVEAARPEALAIGLLGSYRDGGAEEEIASLLGDLPLSLSHRISPEFREYERIATTVLNAYLQPVVSSYLADLSERLADMVKRVLILRSSGGLASVAGASSLAASILLSGPAGGVVAAAACGSFHSWNRVVSFDMGGTSTDVCRIENGRPELVTERTLEGITCRLPSVAIHTIGAGGGSIAWLDAGGALRVGPTSAGAWPGPASYGRGGRLPTVTDANLLVGRLGTESALAGGLELSVPAAHQAVEEVAARANLEVTAVAAGVIEVVEIHMERALRRVSIEQGADPRGAALVAFGGAGGLHATALARRLQMPAVLIPPHAGVFSALGLLMSPPRHDQARTVFLSEGDVRLAAEVDRLLEECRREFRLQAGHDATTTEVQADLRYPGQSHETMTIHHPGEGWHELTGRFHQRHHQLNGFSRPEQPVELVTIRVAVSSTPSMSWSDLPSPRPQGERVLGERTLTGGERVTRHRRLGLAPGDEVTGPAVIEEAHATIWVDRGERALVLEDGTLEIRW